MSRGRVFTAVGVVAGMTGFLLIGNHQWEVGLVALSVAGAAFALSPKR